MRAALVEAIRECVGAPFRPRGRSPETGIDCVGIGVYAARRVGLEFGDFLEHQVPVLDDTLERELDRVLEQTTTAKPGDALLCFGRRGRLRADHLAWLTSDGPVGTATIVHGLSGFRRGRSSTHMWGEIVEHRLGGFWSSRVIRAYRIPGVD